jgi:signal transduction histidine kinase
MSNPLNFVNNFTEGSLELYSELSEMLEGYRDKMADDDVALLNEISEELTASLRRVQSNGGRAFAIVERMRGLGVVGGDVTPSDLNAVLRSAVRAGCDAFRANWDDFEVQPVLDLDDSLTDVPLVEQDFREALVNLVSNACYAMRLKADDQGDGYEPFLTVSSRRVDDAVEVRVRDNGPGIADGVVGRIFDPFFSTREGVLGAGLGLPIAADVARRMGGDLSVDTVFGEYTEFTMSLPATIAEQDD